MSVTKCSKVLLLPLRVTEMYDTFYLHTFFCSSNYKYMVSSKSSRFISVSLSPRSFTTAAVCPPPSRPAAARQCGWVSVLMLKTAAGVSRPTWLCPSSAPSSTLWEPRLATWSSYGRCTHFRAGNHDNRGNKCYCIICMI